MQQDNVVRGMFGHSTSGFGDAEVAAGSQTPPTGVAPTEMQRETQLAPMAPANLIRELELILGDVRIAANRLINLPPPGVVPADVKSRLLLSYTSIEAQIRTLADRAATTSDPSLVADASALQTAAMAYVAEVESTLQRLGVAPTPMKASKDRSKLMLYGLLTLGVGFAGFAGWKAYQHSQGGAATGTKRPVKTGRTPAGRPKRAAV
jgi:hypothetical protein